MFIGIYDPLGAKTDRLRCEVCQNLILSPMNTGLLRPAVATAPTVHGIETFFLVPNLGPRRYLLQQHLPFTVLKLTEAAIIINISLLMLQQHLPFTVLKPDKKLFNLLKACIALQQHLPFTVLKPMVRDIIRNEQEKVATAPTVHGIETLHRPLQHPH